MTGSRIHFLINDSGCHVQGSAGVPQEGRECCYNRVGVVGNRELWGSDWAENGEPAGGFHQRLHRSHPSRSHPSFYPSVLMQALTK